MRNPFTCSLTNSIAKYSAFPHRAALCLAEIYLSQRIAAKMMDLFKYEKKQFVFPPTLIVFYLFTFPFKLLLAFFLNINRIGNFAEMIKKRFALK